MLFVWFRNTALRMPVSTSVRTLLESNPSTRYENELLFAGWSLVDHTGPFVVAAPTSSLGSDVHTAFRL